MGNKGSRDHQYAWPETPTGPDLVDIWSDVLTRPIVYGGDDLTGFEQNLAAIMPK
ncbi:hypothetical protein HGP14_31460 [Rhizobium sp. P32RR-XVIII]|uniref:hypothetical protein n=1 Tax=Rhizobium sp. P32RR-XVIII TaxID=2726738 RepID=UPI0014574127|nr:hypothetical protein [Rhizobium sp. P32RR-XVIII]NLS07762.1 hypothetical protein [Rhizobium sp. P32RR-XVIII]